MAVIDNILKRLFPRLAKVIVGGTLTTNSDRALYPVAIANELLGGHHGVGSLTELADIAVDRLQVPMLATVSANVINNVSIPSTLYTLDKLPIGVDRISDIPNYKITDYWKVVSTKGTDGRAGKDGIDGKPGDRGQDGDNGKDGLTKGITSYQITAGGDSEFSVMGNYARGLIIDTGNTNSKKLKIKGWVNAQMSSNWCTLRLSTSATYTFNGQLLSQANYHTQDKGKAMQWSIDSFIQTSNRYIGFSFSDNISGQLLASTFALEVFVLN